MAKRRDGRFKLADGGTIFLDEVGELPADLQAKLLRVLQEGEYEPVGSSRTEKVDVRVVAATNQNLEAMAKEGTFRRDLLYRLNVFPLNVPPLSERGEDVVLLTKACLRNLSQQRGRKAPRLTEDDKVKLRQYDWPGNVRELQNVIERAVITSRTQTLCLELPDSDDPLPAPEASVETQEITFDYNSTEWKLTYPFRCNCHGTLITGRYYKEVQNGETS